MWFSVGFNYAHKIHGLKLEIKSQNTWLDREKGFLFNRLLTGGFNMSKSGLARNVKEMALKYVLTDLDKKGFLKKVDDKKGLIHFSWCSILMLDFFLYKKITNLHSEVFFHFKIIFYAILRFSCSPYLKIIVL